MANWWLRGKTAMIERVTIESLDRKFDTKIDRLTQTIEDLASMVKQGFDQVDQRFAGVDRRFEAVEGSLHKLEQGQERIWLRLDESAYRFELIQLTNRVQKIENKVGL
jgi:hypothetical protein